MLRPNLTSSLHLCIISLAIFAGLIVSGDRFSTRVAAQGGLSDQQKRGKQIYVRGTSSSGKEIFAYVGESSLEVPGRAMPCANCHALDGLGKPEGGVNPSNLTWEALTKPYKVTESSGRERGPYSERALYLAIARGLDPAGHKLLNVMPRYQMSPQDMSDLIAYLKRLGNDRDPGLTENSINIGMVLPSNAELSGLGQAVKAVMTAYCAEVNSHGGIYNRKLNLKFAQTGDTPAATAANVKRFVQDDQIFVMTGVFSAGADREVAALMNELELPSVGPFTLFPQVGHPLNREVFYLLSGMNEQARALVNFAVNHNADKKDGALVIYPETNTGKDLRQAVRDQCVSSGCGPTEEFSYSNATFDAAALAANLKQTGKKAVFFLGSGKEELALLAEADRLHWSPEVYGFAGSELLGAPSSFNQRVFMSFPTSPVDQTAEGIAEFRAFNGKYQLPSDHLAAQVSAFASAKILVEGLKKAGKDLSREKLIQALEGLYEYPTGLTPPVTYGPNRRIGAMGAYIVSIDLEKKQYVPVSGWIKIN